MLPYAVRNWARVVGLTAKLAYIFDHHADPVGVPFAKMPTAGIVGTFPAEPNGPVANILTSFALLAKSVVLELQHRREGERIIRAGNVDVLWPNTGIGPEDFASIVASDGRDR